MKQVLQLTAVIEREGDGYVATCPEVDAVSQGDTIEEAQRNLLETIEGFFEAASPSEIRRRGSHSIMQKQHGNTTITVPVPDHDELRTGTLLGIIRQSGLPRELFETR